MGKEYNEDWKNITNPPIWIEIDLNTDIYEIPSLIFTSECVKTKVNHNQ